MNFRWRFLWQVIALICLSPTHIDKRINKQTSNISELEIFCVFYIKSSYDFSFRFFHLNDNNNNKVPVRDALQLDRQQKKGAQCVQCSITIHSIQSSKLSWLIRSLDIQSDSTRCFVPIVVILRYHVSKSLLTARQTYFCARSNVRHGNERNRRG